MHDNLRWQREDLIRLRLSIYRKLIRLEELLRNSGVSPRPTIDELPSP